MQEIKSDKPVVVTGCTGYVASWIVYKLLKAGVDVRGTVRDISNRKKYEHLTKAATEFSGDFTPFEADLLDEGSFDDVIQDCEIVIHTASPFKTTNIKKPVEELVKPALTGTRNVLNSVNKIESVKRVVLTASVVSIYGDASDIKKTSKRSFTEEDWNTTSSVNHQPYPYSKVIAEKEAWKMEKAQQRWNMVTIHPGFVFGPSLTERTDSTSIDFMRGMVNGRFKSGIPELYFGVVDVRDVADAHIFAAFNPEAHGRYLCVADSMGMLDIAKTIKKSANADLPLPSSYLPKLLVYMFGPLQGLNWKFIRNNIGVPVKFDSSRLTTELGVQYRSLQETIQEHAEQVMG